MLIGREDALTAAHLLTEVYEPRLPVGRITEEGCVWMGRTLPPPSWPDWRAMLEEERRILTAQGCGRVIVTVSPGLISAGWAEGLRCGRAVLCDLKPKETEAVWRYLNASADALAVNLDDPAARTIAERWQKPLVTYAERRQEAHLTGQGLTRHPGCLTFEAVMEDIIARVRLPQPGSYELYGALAALAGAQLDGIPVPEAAKAISAAPPMAGRFEPVSCPEGGRALVYRHPLGRGTLERMLSLAELLQAEGEQVTILLSLSGARSDRAIRRMVRDAPCPVVLCPKGGPYPGGIGSPEGGWFLCAGPADWKQLLSSGVGKPAE